MPTTRKYATPADRQAAYRTRRATRSAATGPPAAPPVPGVRRWTVITGQVRSLLEGGAGEMAAYQTARSETWQRSERGELCTETVEALEEILEMLQDLPLVAPR